MYIYSLLLCELWSCFLVFSSSSSCPFCRFLSHSLLLCGCCIGQDELQCPHPSLLLDPSLLCNGNNSNGSLINSPTTVNHSNSINSSCNATAPVKGVEEELPRTPVVNRRESSFPFPVLVIPSLAMSISRSITTSYMCVYIH